MFSGSSVPAPTTQRSGATEEEGAERTEGLVGEGERWGRLTSGCDLADVCRQQLTAALVTCTRLGQSEFQQGGGAPEAPPLLDSYTLYNCIKLSKNKNTFKKSC